MTNTRWLKVLASDELPEGRVKAVACGHRTVCMTHFEGRYAALDNRCPHQGGPLGEGSIENGWLRCPWHGWDFHPLTGASPGALEDHIDRFDTEVREDGVYVAVPEEDIHQRTTSDVLVETAEAWGVRHVFGMVGHSNLGLADAIRRRVDAGGLDFIGIRHEGAAAFAASAYGKLTGRPAACFSIAGPGATNMLTGLWDAHVDGAPVLAWTGQVPSTLLGRGAFQEVDLAAAFGGVAVWSGSVATHSNFAELMGLACKHALERRGVSHLVFPDDMQTLPSDAEAGSPKGRIAASEIRPPREALEAARASVRAAKRPAIIVGHGARDAMPQVMALARRLQCPVMTTFKAKGLVADTDPLGCGVLGRSGTPIASWFMNEADLLIVLGSSFANHTGITSYKTIVQVDDQRERLGRFHGVTVPVWGNIGESVDEMQDGIGECAALDQRAEIVERWRLWRSEKARRLGEGRPGHAVHSAAIFAALSDIAPEDAIICVDVGNNTYSFGRYFECKAGQRVLMSGYLGSIGFGFPAAMGAWAATQEPGSAFAGRPVIAVSGDGGFGQYMGEYLTARKYNMNITHLLVNNAELGKISKEQRAGNWDVWETNLHNPDFSAYAELCGIRGRRVTEAGQLPEALAAALAEEGPAMVEVVAEAELL